MPKFYFSLIIIEVKPSQILLMLWILLIINTVRVKRSLTDLIWLEIISSVQFSCSVMSDSLWPHGLQHTRLPCPSPTPGVYSNSCPLSRWCHPTISSSVIPFSSCLQFFPASGSFPVSQLFFAKEAACDLEILADVSPFVLWSFTQLGFCCLREGRGQNKEKTGSRVWSNP